MNKISMSVRLTERAREIMKVHAEKTGLTMSAIIELALREYDIKEK